MSLVSGFEQGIEMIAPHKRNWRKANTQDGRKLRRYKRRWKIERLFAWLHKFRRIIVRLRLSRRKFPRLRLLSLHQDFAQMLFMRLFLAVS
jgi:transposase